jgi:hypothetical protein
LGLHPLLPIRDSPPKGPTWMASPLQPPPAPHRHRQRPAHRPLNQPAWSVQCYWSTLGPRPKPRVAARVRLPSLSLQTVILVQAAETGAVTAAWIGAVSAVAGAVVGVTCGALLSHHLAAQREAEQARRRERREEERQWLVDRRMAYADFASIGMSWRRELSRALFKLDKPRVSPSLEPTFWPEVEQLMHQLERAIGLIYLLAPEAIAQSAQRFAWQLKGLSSELFREIAASENFDKAVAAEKELIQMMRDDLGVHVNDP